MKNEISYMRQEDIFNPINQKLNIIVLGAGSLGSFITLNLAKLGFKNISVYDYDKVENHNIPNQFYRIKDIGEYKVKALQDIINEFCGININIINKEVTDKTIFDNQLNTLFILTFDTLENRKKIYNILKDNKCNVMDVRVGGEEYNIRIIDTFNDKDLDLWKQSLEIKPTKLPCGARSIIYTNLAVASEVCNIVKKINNDEKYPTRIIRHMKQYLIINNQGVKDE